MKTNNHLDDAALYSIATTFETAQLRAQYAMQTLKKPVVTITPVL